MTKFAITAEIEIINTSYAELVATIAANSLKAGQRYRITDYQTVHTISGSNPAAINTGPVEPLVVTAGSTNGLLPEAYSETYPQDSIIYTTSNANGSTKGRMLTRTDRSRQITVQNDFRHVLYRRYKYNPTTFDPALAYARYAVVLYNNAIYVVNKVGGFAAGTATTPDATSDDWVQVIADNSYYWCRGTAGTTFTTSNSTNVNPRNFTIPVNAADFIDVPMFQDYNNNPTRFGAIKFGGPGGVLHNVVFYHKNQTDVAWYLDFGQNTNGVTFAIEAAYMRFCRFSYGIQFSSIHAKGQISEWNSDTLISVVIANVSSLQRVTGAMYYVIIRDKMYFCSFQELRYMILPNEFREFVTPNPITGLKFYSNATVKDWNVFVNMTEYAGSQGITPTQQPEVTITVPLSNKTFIGNTQTEYMQGADFQAMFDRAISEDLIITPNPNAVKSVSANYSVQSADATVRVDTSSGNKTITLPLEANLPKGKFFEIEKTTTDANTVTIIVQDGGGLIDGSASVVLTGKGVAKIKLSETGGYYVQYKI